LLESRSGTYAVPADNKNENKKVSFLEEEEEDKIKLTSSEKNQKKKKKKSKKSQGKKNDNQKEDTKTEERLDVDAIVKYQEEIRERFSEKVSPNLIPLEKKSASSRADFMQYSKKEGVLLIIENNAEFVFFIHNDKKPKPIPLNIKNSKKVTDTALSDCDRYLFIAQIDGKIYRLQIDWKEKTIIKENIEAIIDLKSGPIYIEANETHLYVAVNNKYEILEIYFKDLEEGVDLLKEPDKIKVVDRFKEPNQIKVSKDRIAYSNSNSLRVYSKEFGWQEFEKKFKSKEFKKCIFEFNQKGSYFGIGVYKTIKIYKTADWTESFSLTCDKEIKAFSFTEDGLWITGISLDYTIYIWYLPSKSSIANFITKKFIDETQTQIFKGKERGKTISSDQLNEFKPQVSDPSHEIIIDQRLNKIYCFDRNDGVLSYSGPFLDYYAYKDSNLEGNFQTLSLIENDYILRADEKNIFIWKIGLEERYGSIPVDFKPLCSAGRLIKTNLYEYMIGSEGKIYQYSFDFNEKEFIKPKITLINCDDKVKVNCIVLGSFKPRNESENVKSKVFYVYGTSSGDVFILHNDDSITSTIKYPDGSTTENNSSPSIFECVLPYYEENSTTNHKKKDQDREKKTESNDNSDTKSVSSIDASHNIIVAGHKSGLIRLFKQYYDEDGLDLKKYTKSNLKYNESGITLIKIFMEQNYFISASEDKKCIIWSIEDGVPIKFIDIVSQTPKAISYKISSIQIQQNSILISLSTGMILFYEWPSLSKILELRYKISSKTEEKPKSNEINDQLLLVTEDTKYLIVSNNNLYHTKNPMCKDNLRICGSNINIPELYNFIKVDCKKDITLTSDWIILPYMINCLHYYAYRNNDNQIKEAFNKKIFYLECSRKRHPLNISLVCKNIEASAAIISSLRKKIEIQKGITTVGDRYALETLDDCLVDLNVQGFRGLDEVYRSSLMRVEQDELPDFCLSSIELPKISFKSTMFIKVDEFFKDGEYRMKDGNENTNGCSKKEEGEEMDQRIVFYTSCFTIDIVCGSKYSIDFLDSLLKSTNTEIFSTKFIKQVLDYKRTQIYHIIIILTILNALIIIPNCLFVAFKDPIWFYIYLGINKFLLAYEILQMVGNLQEYVKNSWNYIDMIRNIFLYIYSYFYFFDDRSVNFLMVFITILTFTKGITCFSLFSGTRYLISLLYAAMIETIPFGMIVLYSTFAFAFVNLSILVSLHPDESQDILDIIKNSYHINIGDFIGEQSSYITYLVFVLATIINLILLMNLLISILGGVVDKVQERSEVEDQQSLAAMILDVERIFSWNYDKQNPKILHLCETSTPSEIAPTVEMMNKFKSLKEFLKNISNAQINNQTQTNKKFGAIESKIDDSKKFMENLKKESIAEIKSSNAQLKLLISDITLTNRRDPEMNKGDFVCLCDNKISTISRKGSCNCFICKESIPESCHGHCSICNFNFCEKCLNLFTNYDKYRTDIRCNDEHILLYFPDLQGFYKKQKYLMQKCRMCHNTNFVKGYHCIVCIYSICKKCKDINSDQSKLQITCKKHHQLKWKQDSNLGYSLIQKCTFCIQRAKNNSDKNSSDKSQDLNSIRRTEAEYIKSSDLDDTNSKAYTDTVTEEVDENDTNVNNKENRTDDANQDDKNMPGSVVEPIEIKTEDTPSTRINLRVGVGFYNCNICSIMVCTDCFNEEYFTNHQKSSQSPEEDEFDQEEKEISEKQQEFKFSDSLLKF
jgi:hypothetical protein